MRLIGVIRTCRHLWHIGGVELIQWAMLPGITMAGQHRGSRPTVFLISEMALLVQILQVNRIEA